MSKAAAYLFFLVLCLPALAQDAAPEASHSATENLPANSPTENSQAAAASVANSLAALPGAAAFVDDMVNRYQFDRATLTAILAQARLRPSILEAMARPSEAKPWSEYRGLFVEPKRIVAGLRFWSQHEASLARAQAEYGVPASMIVAIIGVETFYGRNTGSYRVLDALATLAFSNNKRADYFRDELAQYLLLARSAGFSPLSVKGSYAGAMGISQFMPSSYRSYGIDFDKDGHSDLWTNPDDAIGSVANYFQRKGWVPGAAIGMPVRSVEEPALSLANQGWNFRMSLQDWQAIGLVAETDLAPTTPAPGEAMLLELQGAGGKEYWLVYSNFYVITRYNHSFHYAMAVWQLSLALQAAHQTTP